MTDKAQKEREEAVRTPLVDIFETDEGVTFQFELPGVSREDIDISLEGDTLRVASHAEIEENRYGDIVLREFVPANFFREFVISRDLDRDNLQASWHDGVLTLMVPKAATAKPRKIEIAAV